MLDNYKLRVNKITPSNYSTTVNVNSKIEIHFNLELNTDSALSNIYILKDKNRDLVKNEKVVIERKDIVIGSYSYKDKTIFFSPQDQLEEDCRYVVYIEKDIIDISNRTLEENFIGYFDTEGTATLKPCEIVIPKNNSMVKSLSSITVEAISDKYILQISKSKEFERVYKEVDSDTNTISFSPLPSGSFYIRAKAVNGDFGETIYVTIKAFKDTLVQEEDSSEDFYYEYEEVVDDGISLNKTIPEHNAVNVSQFTNSLFFEYSGNIPFSGIDIYSLMLMEDFASQDDNDDMLEPKAKDFVINYMYDEENNKTYIILFLSEVGKK